MKRVAAITLASLALFSAVGLTSCKGKTEVTASEIPCEFDSLEPPARGEGVEAQYTCAGKKFDLKVKPLLHEGFIGEDDVWQLVVGPNGKKKAIGFQKTFNKVLVCRISVEENQKMIKKGPSAIERLHCTNLTNGKTRDALATFDND